MRISHEVIYIQGRGALRRELSACLRSGRALRISRERARNRGKAFVAGALKISDRPAEIADRVVPGHWDGDLILGLGSFAIGTLVARKTRFTLLLYLPRMEGHGKAGSQKKGPALAGHGAEAVRDAIIATIIDLPAHLRRSLTWGQGQRWRSMPDFGSRPAWTSTSAIRKARGSAGATRITTVFCANTFPKGPTSAPLARTN